MSVVSALAPQPTGGPEECAPQVRTMSAGCPAPQPPAGTPEIHTGMLKPRNGQKDPLQRQLMVSSLSPELIFSRLYLFIY